ncbi:AraC family transcriptional regulator [Altererythrobacter xixiisoli]|uniref:AraC family transcriptional regulator n=1 Tax=Croceibacterium xixiisoli TaxID=1476466 RepID=A0A6I4TPK6_9SPHN|nr:AraC family transcriptional regulator [Croceibacterium xixiisoli]MXO97736.1 AraC family transcriptional regulator [Croceibacterium xixiisoli]
MPIQHTDPDMAVFTAGQTRGIAGFAARDILCASDALGWTRLHVSHQRELPFSGWFAESADHLFVLHRQGTALVDLSCGPTRLSGAVGPGAMSVLPGGVKIRLRLHGPLETVHLSLRGGGAPSADNGARPTPTPTPAPALGQANPALFQLTDIAADMMYVGCGDGLAGSVARMLSAELADMPHRHPAARFTARQFHDVYRFIRQHLDQPLRLEDLALVACTSTVHFARRFREATGWSPHQFLIGLRLAVARGLLRGADPIAQIAAQCGFSHQEHMTRLFRQWLGITPAAWRRRIACAG